MELVVNGKTLDVMGGTTVTELLERLSINPLRVAVQLNLPAPRS
jgi:sulfur carrier protein ThiS